MLRLRVGRLRHADPGPRRADLAAGGNWFPDWPDVPVSIGRWPHDWAYYGGHPGEGSWEFLGHEDLCRGLFAGGHDGRSFGEASCNEVEAYCQVLILSSVSSTWRCTCRYKVGLGFRVLSQKEGLFFILNSF